MVDSRLIALDRINTFDDTHQTFKASFIITPFNSLQTLKHRATIDLMKICILEGQRIRPISVVKLNDFLYQRLDGFCRYWAYKELGRGIIPCVFGTEKGEQSDLNPFIK